MRQDPPVNRLVPPWLLCSAAAFSFLLVTACAKDQKDQKEQPKQTAVAAQYDEQLTSTARVLAGMATDFQPHAQFTALEAWKQHSSTVGKDWAQLRKHRETVIDGWRAVNLSSAPHACTKLLYPFAGPDFLNVYIFFPDCDSYVLFGLEAPGAVPKIDGMSDKQAAALLDDMRAALEDLFKRNYFITKKMMNQLSTPNVKGVLPLITASMALFDIRIVEIVPYELPGNASAAPAPVPVAKQVDSLAMPPDSAATQADSSTKKPPTATTRAPRIRGVKITFLQPKTDKTQVLYYFALDVSDGALGANPGFLPYLADYAPAYTFIKSASYLLHGPYFLKMRQTLLDATEFLVQDDTGFPYRLLVKGGWQISLFGNYGKPVKDFGQFGYQRDLDSAFALAKPGGLPFTFGYHWWDGKSSMIVAHHVAGATPGQKAPK